MVIDLQQYRSARAAQVGMLKNGTYGGEVMNSKRSQAVVYWYPKFGVPASPELPGDLSTIDINALLDRVYPMATQI